MLSDQLEDDIVQGLDHDLEIIVQKLIGRLSDLDIVTITGKGGIGKTTLAKKAYDHLPISHPDKWLGILGLSYHHLPNHLKPCFLSMGDFPEDFQIETGRLIQFWIAEGFIRTTGSHKSLEEVAINYLEDLISRNLIQAGKRRFHAPTHNVRRFSFQSQFCSGDDFLVKAYLFDDFSSRDTPIMRELFYRFNLLRVLAIVNVDLRFRLCPLVITKLFRLSYLQVQLDGDIPESILEHQNLQTLVCSGYHFDITLPGKIWMMKNLRYVHLAEATYSPSPRRESILNKHLVTPTEMPNLEGFFDLSYASCTNEVFSGTPNLKRLIIPVGFNCLPNRLIDMSSLTKLEAFKWYWNLRHWYTPILSFVFPPSLKRLTLASCRADDDAWRISDKDKFKSLKLLLLNNLNLKYLEASGDNFPNLKRLVLKNCYDLQETPFDFGEICTLESIEIHDCSTTAEDSARVVEQEQEDMGNNFLKENKGYSDGPSNASFQMLNL
ncbi:hypothetical protein T459_13842 [Capsicum annuum]|uniref:Uncharacterized protein n=1 Tax=Capsicum annuum TaxID=4072 RepID=A0A2G2ZFP4_CAPAN|nr:putative premnaspirodiene oxygenase-like [Capsicum annuum]PHT80827.1 hypothetical protein T459_13842 [Capsicum annuum]